MPLLLIPSWALAIAQRPSEEVPPARDSSPMKRLKRSRASIGATASAAVMAAQAPKKGPIGRAI